MTVKSQKEDGAIALTTQGLIYKSSPDEDAQTANFSWTQITAGPTLSSAKSKNQMMKFTTMDKCTHIFQLQSRKEAERIKKEIILHLNKFRANRAESPMLDQTETTSFDGDKQARVQQPGVTKYRRVSFSGQDGGYLVLTDQGITFFNANNMKDLHLSWKMVIKHKVTPASTEVHLIRLVDSNLVSYIFQMKDRLTLDQIRIDVKERRKADWLHRRSLILDKGPESQTINADALKCHGANRMRHRSMNASLGSFHRVVGPAGDTRELEYLSSLHQTGGAESHLPLRSDGTISCRDFEVFPVGKAELRSNSHSLV